MGGGNIMHTNLSSSSSTVLPNLKPSVSTINTLSCTLCHCHNQLSSQQQVPSQGEVEDAVSALQQFIQAFQQISGSYDSRTVISRGYKRLYDAFQLLQSDPAVKRLVVSLSSDKALWDAFMSNVLHQKLLELPDSVECRRPEISELNEFGTQILSWTLDVIKRKILELIESFQLLVNDLFQSHKMENDAADASQMDEKVRSSFLLSIVILLIVIVARSQR
ncbi:uncharacterized protein LOC124829680 [Vigna umbellata]|uniref:uncharacterized protein LOC124829680 n=1 Tax=Vigna umbellata TaxID=87088 RepID=UPI001F5EA2EC|nr:uncharacterized protein LOC124829680 [Vigna umbellata]